MNNDQDDLRPTDAPIDALLHERFGHESAPDLSKVIAERHARGDGADVAAQLAQHESPVLRGTQRPLLTAALVLLGIGAVVGTVWSVKNVEPSGDAGPQHALQQPQGAEQTPPVVRPKIPEVAIEEQSPQTKPGDVLSPKQLVPPQDPVANLEFTLRVLDQHGGPIQNFEVDIVYVQQLNPLRIGRAVAIKGIKRQPRDFKGDYTTIKGLPPGTYAVVVHDSMHAKCMSSPFTLSGNGKKQVEVRMNHGGELRGTVVDAQGRPVSGATVTTVAPIDAPIADALFPEIQKARRPTFHTEAKVQTLADGSFVIKKLAVGNYVLRAEHTEFSPAKLENVDVTLKPRKPIAITVIKGSVVHGRVSKQGKPQENYLVDVWAVLDGKSIGQPHTARTDKQGNFRIAERLPPGRYRLLARMENNGNENPFELLIQMRDSEVLFEIEKGKAHAALNIDLK
tara:strand:- start:1715 stop:3070 length:1356 start_codon:yes stop_codon:yes gene_type:complete